MNVSKRVAIFSGERLPELDDDLRCAIVAIWRGAIVVRSRLGSRRLRVDADNYLIVNGTPRFDGADDDLDGIVVGYEQALADEAIGAAVRVDASADQPVFAEHLRRHDDLITPALRELAAAYRRDGASASELESRRRALWLRAVVAEQAFLARAEVFASVKPSTRRTLLERVATAADFIETHHTEALTLDAIAQAAALSKYHLIRLFRQAYGPTPHAYLMAKRAAVARRLIESTGSDLSEIAAAAGFGTRWSMFRSLHQRYGSSGSGLRRRTGQTVDTVDTALRSMPIARLDPDTDVGVAYRRQNEAAVDGAPWSDLDQNTRPAARRAAGLASNFNRSVLSGGN